MNPNSNTPRENQFVLVGTRVSSEMRERFKELAEREHRTVSGELRRMIEDRLAEADEPEEIAA